jgi:tRNA pseudouridine55 synthase
MFILDKNILLDNSVFDFSKWLELCASEGSAMLINKEADWTSFDVIAKMRKITKIKKIGHCGTLDPFATGLLILCLGKATKQINTFQDLPKQYLATVKFGATTKSFDSEQKEENQVDISHLTDNQIIEATNKFIGKIEQIPPMFSAKKVNGKKLYELARKGIEIELKPVTVEIYSIKIINIELPFMQVLIDCSKGAYIRALARDIGNELGVGGYLTQLSRVAIGKYLSINALQIPDLEKLL